MIIQFTVYYFACILHAAGPTRAQKLPNCSYSLHTRRPLTAHANTHTPKVYAANTPIARPSEVYIVRIDRFTAPVATLACRGGTSI